MSKKTEKDWQAVRDQVPQESVDDLFEEAEAESKPTPSALDHPSYLELEEKLTLAEQKAHESWDKSVRAIAELENVRRRAERDVANAHRYSLEKFATALLPVIDSLEQALESANKAQDASMQEGLTLTMKLFTDVLAKFDIQQLDPIGQIFNPQLHEAMTMQQAEGVEPNTVLAVFQKGYQLNDRVIRPARVVVSK